MSHGASGSGYRRDKPTRKGFECYVARYITINRDMTAKKFYLPKKFESDSECSG